MLHIRLKQFRPIQSTSSFLNNIKVNPRDWDEIKGDLFDPCQLDTRNLYVNKPIVFL